LDRTDQKNYTAAIREAAGIIKGGGLVSFPTETVYGLGANALGPEAVRKIFAAKGRSPDNPLIVHIASMPELDDVADDIPQVALKLAGAFWPGPLAMILLKKDIVPHETTGGLGTVAVRLPSHETARALIAEVGVPIAAPSSNASGKPSATDAAHVEADLSGAIDMILDGGPSPIGIESTVADLSSFPPRILRPGFITLEDLRKIEPSFEVFDGRDPRPRSPGMKYTHYSPAARVIVFSGEPENVAAAIIKTAGENEKIGKKTGVMACDETARYYGGVRARVISAGSRERVNDIAFNLFRVLREFDFYGVDIILAEGYAAEGLGFSVMDRLVRASGEAALKV